MAYDYLNDPRSSQERQQRRAPGTLNPNRISLSPDRALASDLD